MQIVGIDEVGRGCWAGPLLVVAARAKYVEMPAGLMDSKLLSKKQREALFEPIKRAFDLGEGWVQPEEIDQLGLSRAMKLGVARALMGLGALVDDHIIMDGIVNYCPQEFVHVTTMAKADQKSFVVSAASVYAKVLRDGHMARVAQLYPQYQFEKHVGYGTKLHSAMLKQHGVSAIHRRSYRPVQALIV